MSYNSLTFILFFAVYLVIYLCMPRVWLRQGVILVGSLVFYRYAGRLTPLAILLLTSVIVYAASLCIAKIYDGYEVEKEGLSAKEQAVLFAGYKKKSRKYLWAALALILGILIYTKAGRLLHWTEAGKLSELFQWKAYIVPLGISYYTFSSVGYLLDIYWKKAKCERNYFSLLACMSYFPHIVQGPISRYDKVLKQFHTLPGFSYERVCFGLQRMLWGYFKKMVVSDRIALVTSNVFSAPSEYAGVEILIFVILGAVELYADFSGCMDIVIGAAQTMGVTLEENFKRPFFSKSAAEFWRRWHITLGVWFKDYIYMPIAMNPKFMKLAVSVRKKSGNKAGQIFSAAIPLGVVWILTGLWHGTGADYVVWGCYWGTLIILETVLAPEMKKWTQKLRIDTTTFGYRLFQMIRTFLLFCIGRMITVTGSLEGFASMVTGLFREHRLWVLFDGSLYLHGLDQKNFAVVFFGILLMWAVDIMQEKMKIRESLGRQPIVLRWFVYYGVIAFLLIFGMYGSAYDSGAFLYDAF